MNQRFKAYLQSLQPKPAVVAGHVASVAIDPETGQQTHAQIAVGANVLRVKLDAFAPPLANGDAVRLAQYGQAASADYRLAGLEAGGRANTGLFPVLNDGTVLGGVAYPGGDYIFGKLDEGNIHIEAQTGRLYQRVGFDVRGILYPDGKQLFGHCVKSGGEWTPDGANLLLSATALKLRVGTTDTIRLTTDGTAWLERKLHVARNGLLQVGDNFGAHIRMGRVVEMDASGNPIMEAIDRFAVRVFDGSGLPRIALLTGTADSPLSPAWLLGLETDLHYLRYQNGLLQLKGEGIFERGRVGGFLLTPNYLESVNGRVRLVSSGEDGEGGYSEGITLMADLADAAGVIRWVNPDSTDWNIGIEYVSRDPNGYYLKYSHISTPREQTGKTKHVWISGGWGSHNRTLSYDSDGVLDGIVSAQANSISAWAVPWGDYDPQYGEPHQLTFNGLIWNVFTPPTAIPTVVFNGTSDVNAISLANYTNTTEGIHARVLANSVEILIPVDVRNRFNSNLTEVYLIGLKLLWKKAINGAYLGSAKFVKQNFSTGAKETLKNLSNVQQGASAGIFTTALQAEIDAPVMLENTTNYQYFVVLEGKGMSTSGDLRIMGVEATLCDETYKALNYAS